MEAHAPRLIIERNVSAAGKRVAHGTYRLAPGPGSGTTITFEYAWHRPRCPSGWPRPWCEPRCAASFSAAMERLAQTLATVPVMAPAAG